MPSYLDLVERTQRLIKDQSLFKFIDTQLELSIRSISFCNNPLILLPNAYQEVSIPIDYGHDYAGWVYGNVIDGYYAIISAGGTRLIITAAGTITIYVPEGFSVQITSGNFLLTHTEQVNVSSMWLRDTGQHAITLSGGTAGTVEIWPHWLGGSNYATVAWPVRYLSSAKVIDENSNFKYDVAVVPGRDIFEKYVEDVNETGDIKFVCADRPFPMYQSTAYPVYYTNIYHWKVPTETAQCFLPLGVYKGPPQFKYLETVNSLKMVDLCTELNTYFYFPLDHQLNVIAPHAAAEILLGDGRTQEAAAILDIYKKGLQELYEEIRPTYRLRELYRGKELTKFI